MRVREVGEPVLLQRRGPQHAAVSHRVAAPQLLDRLREVPERQHREQHEPLGRVGGELRLVVVVGPHARELQVVVGQGHERVTLERDDVGVQHLGVDAVAVHVRDAGGGVVAGGVGLVEGRRARRRELAPARHAVVADEAAPAVADLPAQRAARLVPLHSGRVGAEACGDPCRPEVGRLGEVRVGIDDTKTGVDGTHGALPRVRSNTGDPAAPVQHSERTLTRHWGRGVPYARMPGVPPPPTFAPTETLPWAIQGWAERDPNRPFLWDVGGGSRTYGQFHEAALRWADAFRGVGVRRRRQRPGDGADRRSPRRSTGSGSDGCAPSTPASTPTSAATRSPTCSPTRVPSG